jgi:SAM-dependent methyltransferase
MGRGRHALALARAGAHVFGVDWRLEAVQDARARARAEGLDLLAWCADLTAAPLPASAFDIIVVTRYLDRGFFQSLRDAVRPGGTILYETFTVDQRQHGRGPTSSAHLLEHGELRQAFEGFDELFYEETSSPDSLARIAARRR